jgi:hypothetical protein
MEQIILTKQVRYFAGNLEVWSVVSIAEMYGLSKTTIRTWVSLPSFPKVYAQSSASKSNRPIQYFLAEDVKRWVEVEPYAEASFRKSALGIGRPKKNPLGAKDILKGAVKM